MQLIVLLLLCFVYPLKISTAQPSVQDSVPADSGHAHHEHHPASHEHHGMQMDMDGMVMNENYDQLPRDCGRIAGEQTITVRAGTRYERQFNGTTFAYDQHEWNVTPCTKVTVTLEIEASVPGGVPDNVVRTVTENGRTLKFKSPRI